MCSYINASIRSKWTSELKYCKFILLKIIAELMAHEKTIDKTNLLIMCLGIIYCSSSQKCLELKAARIYSLILLNVIT